MEQGFNNTKEIVEINMKAACTKATLPLGKMILLGIMAGMFIALGGAGSNVAVHAITNVGLQRTLAGLIFPAGLMMIVLVGGELYTGNCLMIMAAMDKQIKWMQIWRNLIVVILSNLVGALFIDFIVCYCGQLDYSGGLLGAYTINTAVKKVAITPFKAVISGILCNVLVCIAILMATAAKDIAGKILAILFPIWLFVVSGYEHVVANMYYIPAGMIAAQNQKYVDKAIEVYGLTESQLASLNVVDSLPSFLFVTIGNFLGGAVVLGVLCYLTQRKTWKTK